MPKFQLRGPTAILSAIVGLMLGWSAASAQDVAQADDGTSLGTLDVITVIGAKRATQQQDTPIAISTVTSEQLARQARMDILGVADLAPNVTLGAVVGFRAIAGGIRGTGQNSILVTQDSSTGIIVDEFGLNHVQAQFVEMFDVEQIEIYRGPQGTLFGKNTTGGAIVITTKRPVMNEFSADAEFDVGMFTVNNGAIARGKLAINVPLAEDKLSMRLAFMYDYDDGYYRNDKPASGFPNNIPIWNDLAASLGVTTAELLPPELDTSAQGSGERLLGTNVFAAKAKFLFTPTDNYEAYFIFEILRDRSDSPPGVNESPAVGEIDPFGGPQFMLLPLLGFDGVNTTGDKRHSTGVSNQCAGGNPRGICIQEGHNTQEENFMLHQTVELEDITFKLITGYRQHRELLPNTYTGEAFNSLFDAARNLERDSLQIEGRVITNFDKPWNFVAGGVYSEDNVDFRAFATVGLLSLVTLNGSQDPANADPLIAGGVLDTRGFLNLNLDFINDPTTTFAKQDRQTYAFYLDGNLDFTEDLRLTAGIRYTKDKKDFTRANNPGGACTEFSNPKDIVPLDPNLAPSPTNCAADLRSNAISRAGITAAQIDPRVDPLGPESFSLFFQDSRSWDKITWRAVLDYQLDDNKMVYLSYATGFLSGGFTETCSTLFSCQPFDPEKNWNLEAGFKGDWFGDTLRTNLAAFYTRYSDLVRSQVIPFTDPAGNTTQETVNFNAGKSEVYGVEIEVVWVPVENLRIDLNGAYTKHEYIEFLVDTDGDGTLEDLSGLKVPFSPKWQIGGSITYDMALGNGGGLTWNANFHYQSTAEFSVFNSLFTQLESRTLVGAFVTWRDPEERYEISIWGKNLLNEIHRIGANSVAGLWNFTQNGRPREFGFTLGFHF